MRAERVMDRCADEKSTSICVVHDNLDGIYASTWSTSAVSSLTSPGRPAKEDCHSWFSVLVQRASRRSRSPRAPTTSSLKRKGCHSATTQLGGASRSGGERIYRMCLCGSRLLRRRSGTGSGPYRRCLVAPAIWPRGMAPAACFLPQGQMLFRQICPTLKK